MMQKLNKIANNNFLSSLDITYEEVIHILNLAKDFKNNDISIEI